MPDTPLAEAESQRHNRSQKTILIVEDQDEIGSNMNSMLALRGYRVLRAADADAAMSLSEADRPTMILTDLELPTLGPLIDRLRAHETLKDMLVAVIDINHPPHVMDSIRVLHNLDELDLLLDGARK